MLSLELPNLFSWVWKQLREHKELPQTISDSTDSLENQSSYKCFCFPFLQREVRIGSSPKQKIVSSHETINPAIKKPINPVEILLSTSGVVPQSACAPLLPTIKENKGPSTGHTKHHYTLKRWTGNFKYWQIKTEQRVAPPRQSSLVNRNLWFLYALARAITAPSFLSQNNHSRSTPIKLKLLPLLGIDAVILLILLIIIVMANLQQSPPHSPKLQDPRLVLWNR